MIAALERLPARVFEACSTEPRLCLGTVLHGCYKVKDSDNIKIQEQTQLEEVRYVCLPAASSGSPPPLVMHS